MSQQRVLMISVSAGSGHVRAAEALLETSAQFDQVTAQHIDVMKTVSRSFRGMYSDFYRHLINHAPALWAYLYRKTDHAQSTDLSTILRRFIEQTCTRNLIRQIVEFKPDHIICTHFLPADLLSREIRKARLNCGLWVQITDFDLHKLWVQSRVSGYFAANQEVAFKLREHGVPSNKIHVTGIAVAPAFLSEPSRHQTRAELRLDQDRVTALILSGGTGVGSVSEIAAHLLNNNLQLQVIGIAGNDVQRQAELQQLATQFPGRLVALGFSKCIEKLMAASDVVISKPGGLTSSECLIMGVPMLLVDPIPGQEERNGDYLMERGAALKAHDIVSLDYKLRQLLAEPGRLAVMRENMLRHATPDAAKQILTTVLTHTPDR